MDNFLAQSSRRQRRQTLISLVRKSPPP